MVNQIPLPKRSKHDPVTLDEAEAVKKWMKYNNMNIARLKKIMVAVEKNPLGIGEQFYLIDLKKDLVRNLRLSEKVLGVQERFNLYVGTHKHNLRGKDGRFAEKQLNA